MAPLPPRASPTIEAILAAYETDTDDGFREHLGASVIGRECYAERVRVDHEEAERLVARAGRIIFAARPPARVSDDPEGFECRLCPHHGTCHGDRLPERTCRSCLHVTPTEDGAWHCARFDKPLSTKEQRAGCGSHLFIPDLIQGEQVDADPAGAWVNYRKPDGSDWRDGAA